MKGLANKPKMGLINEGIHARMEQLKRQFVELQAEVEQQENSTAVIESIPTVRKKRTMKKVPNSDWDDLIQMVEFVTVKRWMDKETEIQGDWSDENEQCTGELVQDHLMPYMVTTVESIYHLYDRLPDQGYQENSIDPKRISLLRAYMIAVAAIDGSFNHADILNSLAGLGRLGERLAADIFEQDLSKLLCGDRRNVNGELLENRHRREAMNLISKNAQEMLSSDVLISAEGRESIHPNPAQSSSRKATTYQAFPFHISEPKEEAALEFKPGLF